MSPFIVWDSKREPGGCSAEDLLNVPRVFALKRGDSAGAAFPANAAFHMSANFKRNTVLVDNVDNVESMLLCSQRLQTRIAELKPKGVEYLPVTLYDHKKKAVAEKYFLVHLVDPVDCIDRTQSHFETYPDDDADAIMRMSELVLDETKIPPDRVLFKPKGFGRLTLARRDFAQALDQGGFTGLGWKEVADYVS